MKLRITELSVLLLYGFILLNLQILHTTAVTCSLYTTATTCYAQRSSCHWSGTTCLTGAPNSCAQFYQDTTGCSAQSTCTVQQYNNQMCAQKCSFLTSQACVSTSPVRQDCRLNYTNTAYPCVAVTNTVLDDGCNNKYTAATCNAANCVLDPTLNNNCFLNMNKISPIFPCSYWNAAGTQSCQFHAYCVFAGQVCEPVQSTGNTADNSTSFNLLTSVNFINPAIASGSTIATLTMTTLFAQTSFPSSEPWPAAISWPSVQILFPVSNVAPYANTLNPLCSSVSTINGEPNFIDMTQYPYTINQLQQYIYNYTNQYGNLNFDNNAIGNFSDMIYNQPLVNNAGGIVKSIKVSADLSTLQWSLSLDLVALVKNCGNQGAAMTSTSSSRVYTIPVSYIEQSYLGSWTQMTQIYTVTVPTTGIATISSTANYPMIGNPVQVTFPQADCPFGSARQIIQWTISYRNVFDTTKIVGPRYITDLSTINPAATTTLQNCYQDQITSFSSLGCDYSNYLCSSTFTTQSNCRVLTTDAMAFNKCSYANYADRVADMKGNLVYPTSLDGQHIYYVNTYSCPVGRANDNYCALAVNSAANLPDPISASISTSEYNQVTATLNAFEVKSGFLPYATAPFTAFQSISDNYYPPNGIFRFDANFYYNLPLTVMITYPTTTMQQTYDLRLVIDYANITIIPTDSLGNTITSKGVITFNQIRTSLQYTTKNDYDNGCGSALKCVKLPACNGVLGCDGFSISTTILKSISPGDGYQIVLNYRIGLPNTDGSIPNARLYQDYSETMQQQRRFENLKPYVSSFRSLQNKQQDTRQLASTQTNDNSVMLINGTIDFSSNIDYYAVHHHGGEVEFFFIISHSSNTTHHNLTSQSNNTCDVIDTTSTCCSDHQTTYVDVCFNSPNLPDWYFNSDWRSNACINPDFKDDYHICQWNKDHFVSMAQFDVVKHNIKGMVWDLFIFSSFISWSGTFLIWGIHCLIRAAMLQSV